MSDSRDVAERLTKVEAAVSRVEGTLVEMRSDMQAAAQRHEDHSDRVTTAIEKVGQLISEKLSEVLDAALGKEQMPVESFRELNKSYMTIFKAMASLIGAIIAAWVASRWMLG